MDNLFIAAKCNNEGKKIVALYERHLQIGDIDEDDTISYKHVVTQSGGDIVYSKWVKDDVFVYLTKRAHRQVVHVLTIFETKVDNVSQEVPAILRVHDLSMWEEALWLLCSTYHQASQKTMTMLYHLDKNEMTVLHEATSNVRKAFFDWGQRRLLLYMGQQQNSELLFSDQWQIVKEKEFLFPTMTCLQQQLFGVEEIDEDETIQPVVYDLNDGRRYKLEVNYQEVSQFVVDDEGHILVSGFQRGRQCIAVFSSTGQLQIKSGQRRGVFEVVHFCFHTKMMLGVGQSTMTCPSLLYTSFSDDVPSHVNDDVLHRTFLYQQLEVPYFVVGPKDQKKAMIYLHGGPHNHVIESYSPFITMCEQLGYTIFIVNYPGSTGFGKHYETVLQHDWGGVDASSMVVFTDTVLTEYDEVSLYGVSYGGYLALLLAGKYPSMWTNVLAAASFNDLRALYDGAMPYMKDYFLEVMGDMLIDEEKLSDRSPVSYVQALARVNLLLIHGEEDTRCPYEQTVALYHQLRQCNVEGGQHQLYSIPGLQHERFSERHWISACKAFLQSKSFQL
ncbi:YqiA/YcfP family alpha/beta fold hydrolase [Bacillus sp. FSL W7-1360]